MSTPPEWPLGAARRRPRTLWTDLGGVWERFRGLPIVAQALMGLAAAILLVLLVSMVFAGGGGGTKVASRSTTSAPPSTLGTTTTTPPLPPGDDRTVKSVIDGDSFELTDGSKIRLLGIDAPDVETKDCFSAEATQHLTSLLAPGVNVRVAYDMTRTDRFGRTLAWVYRLPDGLFVNAAMVLDGFARQLTTPPNTAHADEIERAEAAAKAAARGLWQTCSTTTSVRPATTAAPAATTTTAPPGTSTSTSTTVATTTSRPATSSTTTTRGLLGLGPP